MSDGLLERGTAGLGNLHAQLARRTVPHEDDEFIAAEAPDGNVLRRALERTEDARQIPSDGLEDRIAH